MAPTHVPYNERVKAVIRNNLLRAQVYNAATTTAEDLRWVEDLIGDAQEALNEDFEPCMVMEDYKEGNLVVMQQEGRWQVSGIFDLMEAHFGDGEADLSRPIAEYLNEVNPKAGLLPAERAARARCRSICGEMHSGFTNLRSALPMNLKAHRPGFKIWSGAQADIERIATIWRECFAAHHGPYLFGKLTMADAMYAPVVTRFLTYDVKLNRQCAGYSERIMALPDMVAWRSAAMLEPEELEGLDMEF